MKYLFVIYTDYNYKNKLNQFKNHVFYNQILEDKNIEIIEWGADFHTQYEDLPTKTQKMIKWCVENKNYDYLIKCDDTIFEDRWIYYLEKINYDKIFLKNEIEHQYVFADNSSEKDFEKIKYYEPNLYWKEGLFGFWKKINQISEDYRGINLLELSEKDWCNFQKLKNIKFNLSNIEKIKFFEGKFYMVSKKFSIFISKQDKFNLPIEDYMIGIYYKKFKK